MSKYTTELRWLVESNYPLGLDKYPIFDEAHRAELNAKIIQHFYFREIAFETPGLFINRLNLRMNEIMPYYNQLFESELLKFDPLTNFDYQESVDDNESKNKTETVDQSHTNTVSSDATNTTTGTSGGTSQQEDTDTVTTENSGYYYDSMTPEQLFKVPDLVDGIYASTAHVDNTKQSVKTIRNDRNTTSDHSESTGTTNSTTKDNGSADSSLRANETRLEKIMRHFTGRHTVSGSQLILEFRETMLNIDMMIVEELNDLFFALW